MDIGVELSLDYAKLSAERLLEAKEQRTCHSGKNTSARSQVA